MHSNFVLRRCRWASCVAALSLLVGCATNSAQSKAEPRPLTVGVTAPIVTGRDEMSNGDVAALQALLVERLRVGGAAVQFEAVAPARVTPEDLDRFDILIEPTLAFPSDLTLQNNSTAWIANVLWLTTYIGYFPFADMRTLGSANARFSARGYRGATPLADDVQSEAPDGALTFFERDRLFSKRFFLSLILLPALHPITLDAFSADQADRGRTLATLEDRLLDALVPRIELFLDSELGPSLLEHGAPALEQWNANALSTHDGRTIGQLRAIVQTRGDRTPSVELIADGDGPMTFTVTRWASGTNGDAAPNRAPQRWLAQFDVTKELADATRLRLILRDGERWSTYTLPPPDWYGMASVTPTRSE